jgi:spore coat protein U-like protein
MKLLKKTLIATALIALAPAAMAATATDDMQVSITIQNVCTIAADDMNFGTQVDVATARTATSKVRVTCSGKGPIRVGLSVGDGLGSSYAQRRLDDGAGNTIDFNLYTAASGGGTVIGDGNNSTSLLADVTAAGAGNTDEFTVHGYVPVQGPKPGGVYTSDLVATVSY